MSVAQIVAEPPIQSRERFLSAVDDEKTRSLIASLGAFDYDLSRLFPKTSGFGSRRDVKRRVTLLKSLEPRFEHLLYPGEQIQFITTGTLSSMAEQYFLGVILAALINKTAFLFTNYRVLMINLGSNKTPKQMQWQIPYDQIRKFVPGNFLSAAVVFKLNDKKVFKFSAVPKADRKSLREYVQQQSQRVKGESFQFPRHQSRDSLCPACSTPAVPKKWECSECGSAFINPKTPALLSMLFPSLGDFYLGHRFMAGLELVGYVVVGIGLMSFLATEGVSALPFVLIVLALEHGIDAALTYHIARKGVMLKSSAWRSH